LSLARRSYNNQRGWIGQHPRSIAVETAKIFFALCLMQGLLALILVAIVSRDGRSNFPTLLSPAFAQQQPAMGSAGGVVVMPAQLRRTPGVAI